jgi:protein-tyrosine phosphatase
MGDWSETTAGMVILPNGFRVRGRGLRNDFPAGAELPEFGLYLTAKPHLESEWDSRWVCWPDFRLPRSSTDALSAFRDAFERSASTRVEIACGGGTGRTGTALAILARYAGVPAEDAVSWVRANYRIRAVETPRQRRFVARADIH